MQAISSLKSQCASITFANQIKYNRTYQKVVQKGGDSEIRYIKVFHNDKSLAILVVNTYTEYHLMHTLLQNFQQGQRYYVGIARNKA